MLWILFLVDVITVTATTSYASYDLNNDITVTAIHKIIGSISLLIQQQTFNKESFTIETF